MLLIINVPYDKSIFNKQFAKLQRELVVSCIRDLKIDFFSREKVLSNFTKALENIINNQI